MKLIDRTGQRYGRLLVTEKSPTPRMWLCACDCGVRKLVAGSNLANDSVRSCGCLAHEHASAMGSNPAYVAKRAELITKHGHKRRGGASAEYKVWLGMKRRCTDATYKDYADCGARGIRVCDAWADSFEAFLADMGPRPSKAHVLNRRDSDGHFELDNCRWATRAECGDTKRTNLPATARGTPFPSITSASRHFGVLPGTALQRIYSGIDTETAVTHRGRLLPRR